MAYHRPGRSLAARSREQKPRRQLRSNPAVALFEFRRTVLHCHQGLTPSFGVCVAVGLLRKRTGVNVGVAPAAKAAGIPIRPIIRGFTAEFHVAVGVKAPIMSKTTSHAAPMPNSHFFISVLLRVSLSRQAAHGWSSTE